MRILLTSDLHLGIDERSAAAPGPARMNTFRKICALAADHDLILIAGDLFHDSGNAAAMDAVMSAASQELAALCERGTAVLFSPGECDRSLLESPGGIPRDGFTHIFSDDSDACYSITRSGETVTVYGLPAGAKQGPGSLRRNDADGFHMALLHADFCTQDPASSAGITSLRKDDIRALNLDFYALGHNHNFRIFKSRNRVIGAYPGSPEAVEAGETGERYVLSITIENGEIVQVKRLAVNTTTVERLSIPCEGVRSSRDIADIVEKKAAPRTALTVVLTGERGFPLDINAVLERGRGFERLDVIDESSPTLSLLAHEYIDENSLRGAFFGRLREMIEGNELPEDIDRRLLAAMIFRMTASPGSWNAEDWHCV
ncbi:MAG TPA: metallophosphoesterase [Spirochaetota bacterium]|nr:metallophosphoesterase [Spirochaetota bacterium]